MHAGDQNSLLTDRQTEASIRQRSGLNLNRRVHFTLISSLTHTCLLNSTQTQLTRLDTRQIFPLTPLLQPLLPVPPPPPPAFPRPYHPTLSAPTSPKFRIVRLACFAATRRTSRKPDCQALQSLEKQLSEFLASSRAIKAIEWADRATPTDLPTAVLKAHLYGF